MEPSLLPRPPEEGARRLALSFLDQAAAAFPRLDDAADAEALHDFRVALRRLRSCLRAYRENLHGIPKKLTRRLRRLAAATGPGRDAEVQRAWLRERRPALHPAHRPGLAWQLGRLATRQAEAASALREEVDRAFPALEGELRHHLSVYRTEVHLAANGPPPVFAAITAAILRRQLDDLSEHLGEIEDAEDEKEAHRARISAKRLRYLLEPLSGELAGAAPLVKRLKELQELLGELHDAHVLAHELAAAVAAAAVERAHRSVDLALADLPDPAMLRAVRRRPIEPGLLALIRQNRERRDHLFRELAERWLAGKGDAFVAAVQALAAALEAGGAGTGAGEAPAASA
jgi:CHAD domain-containing protein